MAELPIIGHEVEWTPARAPSGAAGYRWRVDVEGWGVLLVSLSDEQARALPMGPQELSARVAGALQRYAHSRLRPGTAVLGQLHGWPSPVELHADHFLP